MYNYWGFGLHITSEIEFPELLPASFTEPDVTIQYGTVPAELISEAILKKAFSTINETEYLLEIRSIGKYYAAHGKLIIVEPITDKSDRSIRLFLLGTVMAVILHQRNLLPLHASGIIRDNKITLFAGHSGAGKSTLLANLMKKGYQPFTDDICVLRESANQSGTTEGLASYPMLKLWEDAITKLNDPLYNMDFALRTHLPKYGHFFHDRFIKDAVAIDKIFILSRPVNLQEVTTRKLNGIEAFTATSAQLFRPALILGHRLNELKFKILAKLTGSVSVYEIKRPMDLASASIVSDIVEERI